MRRLWLGLACGCALLAAPCASAQDLSAAIQAYNCGTPAEPHAAPRDSHPSQAALQAYAQQANAWQTSQQELGRCVFAAQLAMDQRSAARVDEYNQRLSQGTQAAAAWQAASGPAASGHQ